MQNTEESVISFASKPPHIFEYFFLQSHAQSGREGRSNQYGWYGIFHLFFKRKKRIYLRPARFLYLEVLMFCCKLLKHRGSRRALGCVEIKESPYSEMVTRECPFISREAMENLNFDPRKKVRYVVGRGEHYMCSKGHYLLYAMKDGLVALEILFCILLIGKPANRVISSLKFTLQRFSDWNTVWM